MMVFFATRGLLTKSFDPVLENNSWADIAEAASLGVAPWNPGDTKSFVLNGQVGNTSFSNLELQAFILGINHNAALEGENLIHFGLAMLDGKLVGLCDAQYGTKQSNNGYFNMNPNNSNSGGWKDSYHRLTLLGNSGTPASPPANSLLAALPADLRAVMKPVTKYSDNTGGRNNTASYVTSSTDYLFELSEFEYHGARTYANSAEQNYQQQYAYYQAGNSKVHYKHNATGTAALAWCRSVNAAGSASFCLLSSNGNANYADAANSWGVAPGFAV